MYVIVVGCGKIGFYLARELLATDNEVVVIERDSQRADAAVEEFGNIVIASDGTEPTVQMEAGARRCDLLIATTGADATNLVACQVAKWSFNVARCVAVVTDPAHVGLFRSLGVDVTISTTELILSHIQEEMPASLVHLLRMQGAARGIVSVRVPADSPAVGRPLPLLALPAGTAVAAVVSKHGEVRQVGDDLRLEPEDEVVAITSPEMEDQLW
ncbi:MAG: TrkA family potassium uptake protein, partial [Dehalococcoidia bacterium]